MRLLNREWLEKQATSRQEMGAQTEREREKVKERERDKELRLKI